MATTIKQFQAMGIEVNSGEFTDGINYAWDGMTEREKRELAKREIVEWAKKRA